MVKKYGSEIRVVKDEVGEGVVMYDMKSIYDKNADRGWIEATLDLSHYIASEDNAQNVYNMGQQCGYILKDKQARYYKLHEWCTHWNIRYLQSKIA